MTESKIEPTGALARPFRWRPSRALRVLQRVSIRASLTGPVLDVLLQQHYENTGASDLEAIFSFPLPPRAVLTGIEFDLAGKRYTGAVALRQAAEERYEAAIAEGDTAVKIERSADGIYTAHLGNLKPNERAVVSLRYAQFIEPVGDAWRIAIPTVLAPLYGDPHSDGGLPSHVLPTHSPLAEYPLDFELLARGCRDPAAFRCTSHDVTVTSTPDAIRIATGAGGRLDRDIVILARLPERVQAAIGPDLEEPGHTRYVCVAAMAARGDASSKPTSISLRVVLDCSGSMAGDSINWATAACQRIVGQLGDADEFSITRFGTKHEHWRRTLTPATTRNVKEAVEWLFDVKADLGGTEMLAAMDAALKLPGEAKAGHVLLITDGQVWAADALLRHARSAGSRVFVLGVGTSPNSAFLKELACASGGTCDLVTPGEDLAPITDRLVARMKAPASGPIMVDWPSKPGWTLQWPAHPHPGEAVLLFAGLDRAGDGGSAIRATVVEDSNKPAVATLVAAAEAGAAVRCLAANERIRSGHFDDPARAAHAYQLVTEWTCLIAVAQRAKADKAGTVPQLVQVPNMVPAGWGGSGTVDRGSAFGALGRLYGVGAFAEYGGDLDVPIGHAARAGWAAGPGTRALAAHLAEDRSRKPLSSYRDALERAAGRLKRHRLSQGVHPDPTSTGLGLLVWAGLPEQLIEALLDAGAQKVDQDLLIEALVFALANLLATGELVTERGTSARDSQQRERWESARQVVEAALRAFLDRAN
jgi:Ca-activated chloride channel family protein